MGAIKDLQDRRAALEASMKQGAKGMRDIEAECDEKLGGSKEGDVALAATGRYAGSVADWIDGRFNAIR